MTDESAIADAPRSLSDRTILLIVAGYAAAFVLFGLVGALLIGLVDILTTRDALLTDYFGVAGIGGGCVNAGLVTLAAVFVYWKTGARNSRPKSRDARLKSRIPKRRWPISRAPRNRSVSPRDWKSDGTPWRCFCASGRKWHRRSLISRSADDLPVRSPDPRFPSSPKRNQAARGQRTQPPDGPEPGRYCRFGRLVPGALRG